MTAYYNEFDKRAAAWLRELITDGQIAPGDVDERSILDVKPDDLRGYTQCHFFAGIGGWSLALRLAGWEDSRPVWTGSCPCQPFSEAGARTGFADERHLWPAWHYLIEQCRPPSVYGEQVEAAIRYGWLDLVRDDMEGIAYAFEANGLPAACVGAPHIRQRLWFVAHADGGNAGSERQQPGRQHRFLAQGRGAGLLGNASNEGLALGVGFPGIPGGARRADAGQTVVGAGVHAGELEHATGDGREQWRPQSGGRGIVGRCGSNFWSGAELLFCRDGKARPVEPGIFPLAHGVPDRVGLLRGAGNAIVPQVAAAFIQATMTEAA